MKRKKLREPRCTCSMCAAELPPPAFCAYCDTAIGHTGRCANMRCTCFGLLVGHLESNARIELRYRAFLMALGQPWRPNLKENRL